MRLRRFRLRTKLTLLMGLSAIALIACVGGAASIMHQRMMDDRVDKMRAIVLAAMGFADTLDRQAAALHLTRAQAIDQFRDQLHQVRFGTADDYLLVQDIDGMVLMHGGDPAREGKPTASKDREGRSTAVLIREVLRDGDSGVIPYTALKPGSTVPQDKISFVAHFKPWDMVFIAGAWLDDVEGAYHRTLWRLGVMGGMILLVTLLIAALVEHDITHALGTLHSAMSRLARGDLSVIIPGTGRGDELREMAVAVQVFKDNAIEMDRLRAEQKAAEQRAEMEKKQAMARLAGEFEANVGAIVHVVASAATELESTATSMSTIASQTTARATAVAATSEEASTNVQAVASATEQLSSSVSEISRQVATAASVATKAVSESERSDTLVAGLAEAAQKIGSVSAMINGIANQTNLLALNATIEAARAGEAGKGFAVVASEVKNLASQTAKATEEISVQIAAIQGVTTDTVAAIRAIGATIAQLNEIAATIAAAVEQQGAATQEIARNVQQAAARTSEVSSNVARVTQAVDEEGAAAQEVRSASGELAKQAEALRGQVGSFLAEVRAA
jgi:methyl-accepting chemotaxis protein